MTAIGYAFCVRCRVVHWLGRPAGWVGTLGWVGSGRYFSVFDWLGWVWSNMTKLLYFWWLITQHTIAYQLSFSAVVKKFNLTADSFAVSWVGCVGSFSWRVGFGRITENGPTDNSGLRCAYDADLCRNNFIPCRHWRRQLWHWARVHL